MVVHAIDKRMENKPAPKQESMQEDTIFLKIQELLENQKVTVQSNPIPSSNNTQENKKPVVIMEAKEISMPETGDETMDDFLADIFK